MCDCVPGQLILSIDPNDGAAHRLIDDIVDERLENVVYVESLHRRAGEADSRLLPGFEDRYHLVEVPPDQESWKASWLQAHYAHHLVAIGRYPPEAPFAVQPNHYLRTAAVSLSDLDFPKFHDDYRDMIGFDGSSALPDTSSINIKVLDSGVDQSAGLSVASARDFVDPKNPDTSDDTGHGTVVAKIIADLAPDASLHMFKVADAGLANEWNVAAALGTDVGVPIHVINVSLQYGFLDKACDKCGRSAGSSRSWVFQRILETLDAASPQPCIVASAGNAGVAGLAYPARFGTVIATGAVNSSKALAGFSSWGDKDHVNDPHTQYFVLPGGESQDVEYVAEHIPTSHKYAGTSFATAYGSGVVANVLAEQVADTGLLGRDKTLDSLRAMADSSLGSSDKYGQGLMRFDP
jgi:subtilisin family serine protease